MRLGLRILVTDGEQRAALAATRNLGHADHTVWVSASRPRSLAGTSRYCAGEFLQADPAAGPLEEQRRFRELIDDLRPEVILGMTDRTLTVLHGISAVGMPTPNAADYVKASDKRLLFEACQRLGIRVPDGFVVEGGELPDAVALATLGTPIVVRPALSWRADHDRWIPGRVTFEADRSAIERRLRVDRALAWPYLVQRFIGGSGCGLFVLSHEGELVTVFAHRRLREKPPRGGVSTLCESVAPPSDLMDSVARYLNAERWSGLAMFEFRRAAGTDQAYLLEVNARPWGSIGLPQAAGIDFVRDWISLTRGETIARRASYKPGVCLRWWWGDVDHFYLLERSAGRSKPVAIAQAFLHATLSGPVAGVWDTFHRDDPVPFLLETIRWFGL